jgi:hypothetical protein
MEQGETDKDIKLRGLLRNFSISVKNTDWIFYLWIIQEKAARKPPTPVNINQRWYKELLLVRDKGEFRTCYTVFKEAYDYLKSEFGDDLFSKSQHEEFEDRYNGN